MDFVEDYQAKEKARIGGPFPLQTLTEIKLGKTRKTASTTKPVKFASIYEIRDLLLLTGSGNFLFVLLRLFFLSGFDGFFLFLFAGVLGFGHD